MNATETTFSSALRRDLAENITLRINLEWLLNPDHLALIDVSGADIAAGGERLQVILDQPRQHCDGFVALKQRRCDLIVIEPIHLLEPSATDFVAVGCIFETQGGVLVREDGIDKLRSGESLRVATPVSRPMMDRFCRRILQGWAGNRGFAVAETQILIETAGFRHVDNLAAGFDAAWLAFANIEGVEATQRGLAVRLVTAEEAGLPGFSALELVARKDRSAQEAARHEAVIMALEQAAARLQADPDAAVALWQATSGDTSPSAVAMVRATLPCLKTRADRRPARWQAVQDLLQEA
jgi:hypothetical protein